jgi:hypothetical protein
VNLFCVVGDVWRVLCGAPGITRLFCRAVKPSCVGSGASATIWVLPERFRACSSVAQWQSIRLLTGGLLVRVQPEEPLFLGKSSTRPPRSADCDVDCDVRARPEITAPFWPPMHPAGLRCSSLAYSRYAHSSRLAGPAPRRPERHTYFRTGPNPPNSHVRRVHRACGRWRYRRRHGPRLERIRRVVERLPTDVAVGLHHRRRHVSDLRLDHPVRQPLFRQRRDRRVPAVVKPDLRQAGGFANRSPGGAP